MDKAQHERLAVLAEELGEVQQVIGKILRHGIDSFNPLDDSEETNRIKLTKELADVNLIVLHMIHEGDIDSNNIEFYTEKKVEKINKWLHHNKVDFT